MRHALGGLMAAMLLILVTSFAGAEEHGKNGGKECKEGGDRDSVYCRCNLKTHDFVNNLCVHKCQSSEERLDGKCVRKCATNQERVDGQCAPACYPEQERINGRCEKKCAANEIRVDGFCKINNQRPAAQNPLPHGGALSFTCAADQEVVGSGCVKKCPAGQTRSGSGCVTACVAPNYLDAKGNCQSCPVGQTYNGTNCQIPCRSDEDSFQGKCVKKCSYHHKRNDKGTCAYCENE